METPTLFLLKSAFVSVVAFHFHTDFTISLSIFRKINLLGFYFELGLTSGINEFAHLQFNPMETISPFMCFFQEMFHFVNIKILPTFWCIYSELLDF